MCPEYGAADLIVQVVTDQAKDVISSRSRDVHFIARLVVSNDDASETVSASGNGGQPSPSRPSWPAPFQGETTRVCRPRVAPESSGASRLHRGFGRAGLEATGTALAGCRQQARPTSSHQYRAKSLRVADALRAGDG